MFSDLVKAMNKAKDDDRQEELSETRLKDLMDELFNSDKDREEEDDLEKAKADQEEEDELEKAKADQEEDELEKAKADQEEDELEKAKADQEEDDLEKASTRRNLMDQVYSLVDNLSDKELQAIIDSKTIKKAIAMQVFNQMETSELQDFMDKVSVNGKSEGVFESLDLDKACGSGYKKSEDLEKAEAEEEAEAEL
jgi:hypothetical protein